MLHSVISPFSIIIFEKHITSVLRITSDPIHFNGNKNTFLSICSLPAHSHSPLSYKSYLDTHSLIIPRKMKFDRRLPVSSPSLHSCCAYPARHLSDSGPLPHFRNFFKLQVVNTSWGRSEWCCYAAGLGRWRFFSPRLICKMKLLGCNMHFQILTKLSQNCSGCSTEYIWNIAPFISIFWLSCVQYSIRGNYAQDREQCLYLHPQKHRTRANVNDGWLAPVFPFQLSEFGLC